jgi:hypothetical protein
VDSSHEGTTKQWVEFVDLIGCVSYLVFPLFSFQSFQEALEKGEASHLMPVFNAKQKIQSGELRPEDIPYMQRGGNWVSMFWKNVF